MGREEIEVIAPAVAELRAEGIDARGPLPADTMFHAAARARLRRRAVHDHDQALIPIKTLAFDSASMSRSACPSCAPRPITARPSTSPARASPTRRA